MSFHRDSKRYRKQLNLLWILMSRKNLEIIETERLSDFISNNANNKILEAWNSNSCLKKLAIDIFTIFSSTYA